MKAKVTKELWILNVSSHVVSVEDLGIKVQPGKSINAYAYNVRLTEDQAKVSIDSGSLHKRLNGPNPTLKIVQKRVSDGKSAVRKIQQSNEPIKAIRTNSAIVIDQKSSEEITDDKGFDFADYGVDLNSVAPVKDGAGVVVKAKEDAIGPVEKSKPTVEGADPMGKMVEVATPSNSFAVVKNKEIAVEIKPAAAIEKIKEPGKVNRIGTESTEDKIEMAQIKSEPLIATKKDCGVVIDNKSDVDFLDSLPSKQKEDGGMRVASRTKNGITVMKIKE